MLDIKRTYYEVTGIWSIGKFDTLREARIARVKEIHKSKDKSEYPREDLKFSDFRIMKHTERRVA